MNIIELYIKYHKTRIFVLSFANIKLLSSRDEVFRNLKLRLVAKLNETQFCWLRERKSSFAPVSSKEPTQNMVRDVGHLLFLYSQNMIL